MTSIADQTVEQLGGAGSVLVRQRLDHSRLEDLLEQLETTEGDRQDEVLHRTWRLVFRHAYAEETVLWPVLRRALPDGHEITLRVEQEHQEINELASALDRGSPDSPDRRRLVARVVQLLREDARDEEDLLLPRLQQAVDARQLRRLGVAWELVRKTAPTRPHAVVSRRPPGNLLAALPLAALDHTRDALDVAARFSTAPRLRAVAGTSSRALARVAGAVENLPTLGRGEDGSTQPPRTQVQE